MKATGIGFSALAVFLCTCAILFHANYSSSVLVLGFVQILLALCCFSMLRYGAVLAGLFAGFVVQPLIVVVLFNFVLGHPFSSWRASVILADSASIPVLVLSLGSALLILSVNLVIYSARKSNADNSLKRLRRDSQDSDDRPIIAISFVSILILLLGAVKVVRFGRNVIVSEGTMQDVWGTQIAWVLALVSFSACLIRWRAVHRIIVATISIIGLVYAVAGFRAILVSLLSMFIAHFLPTVRIKLKMILAAITLIALLIVSLLVVGVARNQGIEPKRVASAFLSGEISAEEVLQFVGAAEQNLVYSYVYFFDADKDPLLGETYLQGIARLLPTRFAEGNSKRLRSQDYVAEAAPLSFTEANLNLGAYFPTEALINWGRWGGVAFASMFGVFLGLIEKGYRSSGLSPILSMLYYGACSLSVSFMLYGFSNSIKTFAAYCLISLVYVLIERMAALKSARLR